MTAIHSFVHRARQWLGSGSCVSPEEQARRVIVALDLPARDAAVRADERAKVRAELLAIAAEEDHDGSPTGHPCCWSAREIADRIAPEPTPKEQR